MEPLLSEVATLRHQQEGLHLLVKEQHQLLQQVLLLGTDSLQVNQQLQLSSRLQEIRELQLEALSSLQPSSRVEIAQQIGLTP